MGERFEKARFEGDDAFASTFNLLVALGLRVSKDEVIDRLEKHPSYPSLEAVTDVLVELGLEVEATMLPHERARGLEPFLSVSVEHGFYVILELGERSSRVVLADLGVCEWSNEVARHQWSGVAIRARSTTDAARPGIQPSRSVAAALSTGLALGAIGFAGVHVGWEPVLMFVLAGLGLWLSLSIDRVERGASAGLASRLCGSIRSGCQSILGSRSSRLFGLRLTDIGVSYFAGWILSAMAALLLADPEVWMALMVLSIPAALFPIVSIALQWRERAWCRLCLLVQGILALQGAIAVLSLVHLGRAPTSLFGSIVVVPLVLLAWIGWRSASSFMRRMQALRASEHRYARLARRPEAVAAILESSRQVAFGNLPGDLSFGASDRTRLDIVVSAGCSACRRLFEELDAGLGQLSQDARVTLRMVGPPPPASPTPECILPRTPTSIWADVRAAFRTGGELPVEVTRGFVASEAWLIERGIAAVPCVLVDGRRLPSDLKLEDLTYYLRARAEMAEEVESSRRAG